ncbi:Gar1/Naf1 RNA binding region-domain-containing protein [Bombardia bombarda]|uniref:H/ACA ribonucleoprotein complex non-core subunit NAF1 n=1 Tax=Bombardia bombarda TaxID=252184 RepID=A0AA39XNF1_9PEZI|nr:Gar1/Naf1 RNA binding region-domain-containing protein [Bombardia bombarda]
MAGNPFQIPGLDQALSDDRYPVLKTLAPDLLAAAASVYGNDFEEIVKQLSPNVGPTVVSSTSSDGVSNEPSAMTLIHQDDAMDVDNKQQTVKQEPSHATSSGVANEEQSSMLDAFPTPDVTHALEAALDGMLSAAFKENEAEVKEEEADHKTEEDDANQWEADSSPYESSSSDSSDSSDDDSDDDSEAGGSHPILGLEETVRLLMEQAASDGEGDGEGGPGRSGRGPIAPLRTKNELPEEAPPKPDIVIGADEKIEILGHVLNIVGTVVVVHSNNPGEVQVLDLGSVLCKEDRTVVGALADTFGTVKNPYYTVGFKSEDEIKELGLEKNTAIYYCPGRSNYALTGPLKVQKGTDASNIHDEEVPAEDAEFSDDEKEIQHKKALKMRKRGGRAARGGRGDFATYSQPPSNNNAASTSLPYEEEDGSYKTLSRPQTFAQGLSLPPRPETSFNPARGGGGYSRGPRGGSRGAPRGAPRGQRGNSRGGAYGNHAQSSQPAYAPKSPQNPHLPPPPYGAQAQPSFQPPAHVSQWPPAPMQFPPAPYAQQPGQSQPAASHQVPSPTRGSSTVDNSPTSPLTNLLIRHLTRAALTRRPISHSLRRATWDSIGRRKTRTDRDVRRARRLADEPAAAAIIPGAGEA